MKNENECVLCYITATDCVILPRHFYSTYAVLVFLNLGKVEMPSNLKAPRLFLNIVKWGCKLVGHNLISKKSSYLSKSSGRMSYQYKNVHALHFDISWRWFEEEESLATQNDPSESKLNIVSSDLKMVYTLKYDFRFTIKTRIFQMCLGPFILLK